MEPSPPDRPPAAAKLMLPSGAILALCFFLPAVRVCDEAQAPYQVPGSFPPYAFGLLIAIGAALLLLRRAVPTVLRFAPWLVAVLGGLVLALGQGERAIESHPLAPAWLRPVAALFCLASLALVLPLLLTLRRGRGNRWPLPTTLLGGGALCLLFFTMLLVDTKWQDICYGLWLSLFASLGLVAGGLLLARRAGGGPIGPGGVSS